MVRLITATLQCHSFAQEKLRDLMLEYGNVGTISMKVFFWILVSNKGLYGSLMRERERHNLISD